MSYARAATVAESEEPEYVLREQMTPELMIAAEESAEPSRPKPRERFDVVSPEDAIPHSIHPLWGIEVSGERLRFGRPLAVTIEESGNECIVSNDALHLWGIGLSKYRALEDFARTFFAVLRSYEQTPEEQLSIDAHDYLRRLRALIAVREAC